MADMIRKYPVPLPCISSAKVVSLFKKMYAFFSCPNIFVLICLQLLITSSLAFLRSTNRTDDPKLRTKLWYKSGKNLEQWLSREGAEVECSLLLRVVEPGKWFSKIDGLPKPEFTLLSAWLKPEYPSAQKSPRTIPEFLKKNFSMDGKIRVEYKYDNRAYLGGKAKYSEWTQELLEQKIQDAKNRVGNSYGEDGKQVFDVLAKYKEYIEGKRALVIGSEKPWVEGGFLLYGAEKVTTLEFGTINSGHPKIETVLPSVFTERFLNGKYELFDVACSYSSLEHDGLGRYGDILNPIGDLQSMAKMLSIIKPGGLVFLGLPMGLDGLHFNLHRYYGVIRLPYLLAGWKLVEIVYVSLPQKLEHNQPVLVLQNMNGCSNKV